MRTAVGIVIAGASTTAVLFGTTSVSGAASPLPIGVYTGAGNAAGEAAFGFSTGSDITIASDYLDGSDGWAGEVGTAGSPPWGLNNWAGNTTYQLVIGIPLNPTGLSNAQALANGAAGDYDGYFTTLAQNAQIDRLGNVIWRPGWEYDQGLVTSVTDAENYAAYYRNIVTAMRAVNPNFRFTWDGATDTTTAWTPQEAYPGGAYVDYIALDFYDQTWDASCGLAFDNAMTQSQEACVWSGDYQVLLNELEQFASSVGKPVCFPEWGVVSKSDGHGGGDDPWFMADFISWMQDPTHNVAWDSYFDFNSGGNSILTDYPSSLAVYQHAFGATVAKAMWTSPSPLLAESPTTLLLPTTVGFLLAMAGGVRFVRRWRRNVPYSQG